MRVFLAVGGMIILVGTLGCSWGIDGGVLAGFPMMTYVNDQLLSLAERERAEASPLWFAWGGEVGLWPWSNVGLGLELLRSSGGIKGGPSLSQDCWIAGVTLQGRLDLLIFGAVRVQGAVGAYAAGADGLVSGNGWALGGKLQAGGRLLSWGGFTAFWQAGIRWLPSAAFYDERGQPIIVDLPVLDFSGIYLEIILSWEGR